MGILAFGKRSQILTLRLITEIPFQNPTPSFGQSIRISGKLGVPVGTTDSTTDTPTDLTLATTREQLMQQSGKRPWSLMVWDICLFMGGRDMVMDMDTDMVMVTDITCG